MKVAVGEPVLPGDDRLWILGQDLVVSVYNGTQDLITVPMGFTTDGASIPPLVTWVTRWGPWDAPQRWAAIVHDWLYTQRGTVRKVADLVFLAVLKAEGAGWWRRHVLYWGVRVGGWKAFKSDQASGPLIFVR